MLYHWCEFDRTAAKPEFAIDCVPNSRQHSCASGFSQSDAIARAKGARSRLNARGIKVIADNDANPDQTVKRLIKTGVGMIDHPWHRAHPATYSIAGQLTAFTTGIRIVFSRLIDLMLCAALGTSNRVWRMLAGSSHTIVSNGTDYDAVRIGAQQPRLSASSQK